MDDSDTHRNWFRFRLGSMFLAITLFALWLGWETHIWRERQQMRRWVKENGGDYEENIEFRGYSAFDTRVEWLHLPPSTFSAEDVAKAKAEFPEAILETAEHPRQSKYKWIDPKP